MISYNELNRTVEDIPYITKLKFEGFDDDGDVRFIREKIVFLNFKGNVISRIGKRVQFSNVKTRIANGKLLREFYAKPHLVKYGFQK